MNLTFDWFIRFEHLRRIVEPWLSMAWNIREHLLTYATMVLPRRPWMKLQRRHVAHMKWVNGILWLLVIACDLFVTKQVVNWMNEEMVWFLLFLCKKFLLAIKSNCANNIKCLVHIYLWIMIMFTGIEQTTYNKQILWCFSFCFIIRHNIYILF